MISTSRGQQVLRDAKVEEDNPDWEKYTYLGYMPQVESHLVLRNHYEWSSYILVSKHGRKLEVFDEPHYSPDLHSFVAASRGIEDAMFDNVIRVFSFRNHVWQEVWRLKPKQWEPDQIYWLSTKTLLLKEKHWSKDFAHTWYTYAKLAIH